MNNYRKLGIAATLCTALGTAAAAPEESATETRAVDARTVRVRLDGVIDLTLRQGAVPRLVLTGDERILARTTALQHGDTISIATETHGLNVKLGRHKGVRAELTLPQLREVASDSVGSTEISGFSGERLALGLDGAGAMKVEAHYRFVSATMGGLGSMHIRGLDGEGVELNLRGAGYVVLSGRSKWLKASLGGLGSLDARELQADGVNLELSGLGNASVMALRNASLNLSGLGSVTVYGKPPVRNVSVDGLGKVSWK